MNESSVSVIVVSRGRPGALCRCLRGLEQLAHDNFEVVVVADPAGHAALETAGLAARVKPVTFDEPNISKARNLGLAKAAGEIVAFIDDDAVAEPGWLGHLAAPFEEPSVDAAGGYVRGRNGISFQYTARTVDTAGRHTDLAIKGEEPVVMTGAPGRAIKTEGTNCAFRRELLLGAGGFDPAFAFYMEETDLNLRMASDLRQTAVVPLAQVHHGFAASDRRHASRMPRTLFDVGASQVLLLRKHALGTDPRPVLDALRVEQRARLMRHMVVGNCEPRDVDRVMATLEQGIAAGQIRELSSLPPIGPSGTGFRRFTEGEGFATAVCLAGRTWQARRLRHKAVQKVAARRRACLFLFSPTAFFHHVTFTESGVWEQRGGLWGKSDRNDPMIARWSFRSRVKRELDRMSGVINHRHFG